MDSIQFSKTELATYFKYLDELRVSGVTNMYGAGSYLSEMHGLTPKDASTVLKLWMQTFSDLKIEERAAKALKSG